MNKRNLWVALGVAAIVGGVAAAVGTGVATLAFLRARERPAELAVTSAALEDASASLDDGPIGGGAPYDLSAHQTLSRVVILIKENYVEPERIKPYPMFLAALDYIQRTVPEVMVDDTEAPARIKVSVGSEQHIFDLERLGGLDQLWEVTLALRDIFRFIQSNISDEEQQRDIEYAAINGMLSTLDPHSVLLKPESFDEVKMSTRGEFGGLGIVISIRDGALTIISPIEGTPAARAGLKSKDQIIKIGEESTVNMSLEEAVQRLRGKPGSKVNVWVLRKGWTEARRFALTRAIIKIESVSSELLADGIGYVHIKNFQANTFDDLDSHLDRLKEKNGKPLAGVVLDLRNNPGGLLDQAILISDRFIDRGPLVITVGEGNRKRDVKNAHAAGTDLDYPIAVLVNGGSASASEIVAGALKNHNRAFVIGQQTFGKGSVQVLYDFKDRSALKLTIAQYLTPGDISIQSVGIVPDVQLVPATLKKDQVRLFAEDDSPHEKDLDHHLDNFSANKRQSEEGDGSEGFDVADLTKPSTRVVYLAPAEEEPPADGGDTAGEAAPVDTDKFKYDFETRLAHDVLAATRARDRKGILAGAAALFDSRAKEEGARIADEIGKLGVDWSNGERAKLPRAEAKLELKTKPLVAGQNAVFVATVKNTGEGTLSRVYGVTESDNGLFKNLEFVFGKVPPGQTRKWEVSVKLPNDLAPRADLVTLTLGDEYQQTNGIKGTSLTEIGDIPKPSFAFRYFVDDRVGGNGDGLLKADETVDFKVSVLNNGRGKADEATVAIKSTDTKSFFLNKGREKLGAMKPSGTKDATLSFSLRTPPEKIPVRITVWDSTLGESASQEVQLPLGQARKTKADRQVLKIVAQSGAKVRSGADESAPVIGEIKPGAVVKSDATFGSFQRVLAEGDLMGFVAVEDTKVVASNTKVSASAVRWLAPEASPIVTLDPVTLVVKEPSVRLKGTVTDERGLKDLFVFVNDRKVHYQSYKDLTPTADGVKTTFDILVPLKVGENTVVVVARESKESMGRAMVGLYRDGEAAVAEAPGKVNVAQ